MRNISIWLNSESVNVLFVSQASYIFATLAHNESMRGLLSNLDREGVVPSEFSHCLRTGKLVGKSVVNLFYPTTFNLVIPHL